MKITLKLGFIVTNQFTSAFNRLCNMPLAPKESYALARTMRDLESHAKDFLEAQRKCFAKYGAVQKGEMLVIEDEAKRVEAVKELEPLADTDVTLFLDHKIVLPEDARVTAMMIAPLLEIVEIAEPKTATPAPAPKQIVNRKSKI